MAVVPVLLLVALGATRRTLGLTRPAPGTWLAAIPCFALPVGFWIFALATGKLSPMGLVRDLIYDVLNAGVPEEVSNRGMLLSHLRGLMRTDWAIVIQALVLPGCTPASPSGKSTATPC